MVSMNTPSSPSPIHNPLQQIFSNQQQDRSGPSKFHLLLLLHSTSGQGQADCRTCRASPRTFEEPGSQDGCSGSRLSCRMTLGKLLFSHGALFSHMQRILLSALGGDYELRVKYICERAFENAPFSAQTTTARLQGLPVSSRN